MNLLKKLISLFSKIIGENPPIQKPLSNPKIDITGNLLLKRADETKTSSDNLLTLQQASQLVNLNAHTLYALVSKQGMPSYKKKCRLYFDKAELINWIQSGKRKAIL